MIYLDNNATTKVDDAVLASMMPFFSENYGNPSSIYEFSRSASRAIQNARGQMKDFFNAVLNVFLFPFLLISVIVSEIKDYDFFLEVISELPLPESVKLDFVSYC